VALRDDTVLLTVSPFVHLSVTCKILSRSPGGSTWRRAGLIVSTPMHLYYAHVATPGRASVDP